MKNIIVFPRHPERAIVIARCTDGSFMVRVRDRTAFTNTWCQLGQDAARSAARDMERRTGLPVVYADRRGPEKMLGRWRQTGGEA